MIYAFITAEKANFPMTVMFDYFKVPSSSYYDWVNRADTREAKRQDDLAMVKQIREVHEDSDG